MGVECGGGFSVREEIQELINNNPTLAAQMVQTWLAFSATNIVFTPTGELVLGVLKDIHSPEKAIPETGNFCLIGGFNGGIVDNLCSFKELADTHLKTMLSIDVKDCLYTTQFTHTEYPAEAMEKPLNTPYGSFPIKRVAFERIVVLSEKQMREIQPKGKIKNIWTVNYDDFMDDMFQYPEDCRFQHQLDTVKKAFKQVHAKGYARGFTALLRRVFHVKPW